MACYGCEVWLLKAEEQRKLLALEMDYLRTSTTVSRLQGIPNTAIRNKMQAEQSILGRIQRRQLKWYDHIRIMVAIRLPNKWTQENKKAAKSMEESSNHFMRNRGM